MLAKGASEKPGALDNEVGPISSPSHGNTDSPISPSMANTRPVFDSTALAISSLKSLGSTTSGTMMAAATISSSRPTSAYKITRNSFPIVIPFMSSLSWIGLSKELERVMGIEPTFEAWEAPVLPLNYTRNSMMKQ